MTGSNSTLTDAAFNSTGYTTKQVDSVPVGYRTVDEETKAQVCLTEYLCNPTPSNISIVTEIDQTIAYLANVYQGAGLVGVWYDSPILTDLVNYGESNTQRGLLTQFQNFTDWSFAT